MEAVPISLRTFIKPVLNRAACHSFNWPNSAQNLQLRRCTAGASTTSRSFYSAHTGGPSGRIAQQFCAASAPTSHTDMLKTETQCMAVDPAVLPWASWPSWRPAGTSHVSANPVAAAVDVAVSLRLAHISSDQALLRATDALPHGDAGMATLHAAAELLKAGRTVAIPTETVYGLAGNALSASAVASIYGAKRRPADNPLIVHVSSLDMLAGLYGPGWQLPDIYQAVVADAWPGPLTILLPRSPKVPDVVMCGLDTMAVRMPAHPVARAIIALSGCPLAAPSANSSGRPSPTRAQHVLEDLGGQISLVVDGGPCQWGVESTVLDGLRSPPLILRPGSVTYEQLLQYPGMQNLKVYKKDFEDAALEAAPTTPGMKYRHYSPNAAVTLLDLSSWSGSADQLRSNASKKLLELVHAEVGRLKEHLHDHHQAPQQPQQHPGLEQIEPQAHQQGTPSKTTPAKRRPRLGVLRTSLGPYTPAGLVGGCQGAQALQHELAQPQHPQSGLNQELCALAQVELQLPFPTQHPQHQQGHQQPLLPELQQHRHNDQQPLQQSDCMGWYVCSDPIAVQGVDVIEYVLGDVLAPSDVGQQLFLALRMMDSMGVDAIIVEGVVEQGAGAAVMNRLRKAATTVVSLGT